ncbi:MAG: yonG [Anaerocolumna sp.]|jgi:hypothetical protein|nr:yonG [Anaerocolumna sp.]
MKEVSTIAGKATKLETVTKNVSAKTQVNKDVKINIKQHDNTPKEFRCTCCGNTYSKQQGNFMPSNFETFKGNGGYIDTCKKCTDQLFEYLTNFYMGNEEKAIDHICMMYGLYFNESPLAASKKISADRSRLSTYSSKIQIKPWIGKTYLNTITERIEEEKGNVIESLEDVKDSKKAKLKSVKFFGVGFDDEDYPYLEDEYLDWTTRHECSTKAQEEVFKQICYAQLDILKAKKKGLPTKDLTKTLQDLLATANLQPKQTKENTLAEQNTFGTLIRKWENEKPIPEPDEEWKDVDGIVKYITIYFLGHLCKMMGIKNSYARMYEQEMDKYKVDKPEYEDDDEALFDAVFGGGLDDSD